MAHLKFRVMIKKGDKYVKKFTFSQEQVNQFAELSGDKNPLHIDPDYAAESSFGQTIVHGVLTISVFSQIIGMEFPGAGTIYLGQELEFKRPIYVGQEYRAELEVIETIDGKYTAVIKTQIFDSREKIALDGIARVKNREKVV